jgi:hypothetical protein
MAKVNPYHTKKTTEVYHVCKGCTVGNNIERVNYTGGKGRKRLCYICERLVRERKC